MTIARDAIDTLLGEAGGRTLQERWADMLHIASVMVNRTSNNKVTLQDVVSAKDKRGGKQFDAYGARLPAGTEKYRGMAEDALAYVVAHGPITSATFYATKDAVKGLPPGLQTVATTVNGHVFSSDPQNRSVLTAAGYVTPAVYTAELAPMPGLPNGFGSTSMPPDRPMPGMEGTFGFSGLGDLVAPHTVATTPYGVNGPVGVATDRPEMAGARTGKGFEALAPKADTIAGFDRSTVSPTLGRTFDALAGDPRFADMEVTSGFRGQARNAKAGGAKASMHLQGKALDLNVRNLSDAQKVAALDLALEKGGVKGVGVYPGGRSLHVDTRTNPMAWGPNPQGLYRGINNWDGKPSDLSEKDLALMPDWAQPSIRDLYGAGPFAITPRGNVSEIPVPTPRSVGLGVENPSRSYADLAASLAAGGVQNIGGRQATSRAVARGTDAFDALGFGRPSAAAASPGISLPDERTVPIATAPASRPDSIGIDMTGKGAPASPSAWDALTAPIGSLPVATVPSYETPRTVAGVSDARPMPSGPIAGTVAPSVPSFDNKAAELAGERVGAMVGPAPQGTDPASAYQQAAQGLGAAGMRGVGGLGASLPVAPTPPTSGVFQAPLAPLAPIAPVVPAAVVTAPSRQATINVPAPTTSAQTSRAPTGRDVMRGAAGGLLGGIPGAVVGGLNAAMTQQNPGPGGNGLGDMLFNGISGGFNPPTNSFAVNSADEAMHGPRGVTYTASNGDKIQGLGGNYGYGHTSDKWGWTERRDPAGGFIGITYGDGSRTPWGGKGLGAMIGSALNARNGIGGLGSLGDIIANMNLGGLLGGSAQASGAGGGGLGWGGFGGGSFNGNGIDPRDGGWG